MTRPSKTRSVLAGFTLIEVMIALAICGAGLIVILQSTSASFYNSRRAEALGIATELARAKMYDLEEELLEKGFQDTNQELDGEFDDEGWETFSWEAKILKIELPNFTALSQINEGGEGGEGDDGGGGSSPLAGIMAMFPGVGGTDGVDPTALAGAGVIESQFELISKVLENSIRKVILTVKWKVGKYDESFTVDCYFTNPKAIDEAFGGLSAGGSGASGSGGSSGTNPASGGALGGSRSGSGSGGGTGSTSGVRRP